MTETQRSGTAATTITDEKWAAVREAVVEAGERFAALVEGVADPATMATADWTVADTAAHVTAIAMQYTAMVQADDAARPLPGVQQAAAVTTVDNIHSGLNATMLKFLPERDPRALGERLRAAVGLILERTEHADPTRPVTWLGGSQLPLAGLLAHLVNELLLHGRDVAEAVEAPWPIPARQAALFFELFLVEIIRNGVGSLLDTAKPPRPGRIAVQFRSAYTAPVTIVVLDGEVSIAEPSRRDDVRVRFDPPALNLMMFHRISRARAALSGGVRVWGRRPWLLPAFLQKVRMP